MQKAEEKKTPLIGRLVVELLAVAGPPLFIRFRGHRA